MVYDPEKGSYIMSQNTHTKGDLNAILKCMFCLFLNDVHVSMKMTINFF